MDDIVTYVRAGGASYESEERTLYYASLLWKDMWKFYPLSDDDYRKMVLESNYRLGYLKALRKYMHSLNLKNFDYEYFNKILDDAIERQFKNFIVGNKLLKEVIKILSINKIKEIKDKNKRIENYLDTHQYKSFLNVHFWLNHIKDENDLLIKVPWRW